MPDGEYVPLASVVVPARNESACIGPRLRSLLAGDYPRDRLEAIVVDGVSGPEGQP